MSDKLTERRWPELIFNPISVDPTSGIVTVADTTGLATKQRVTLTKPGLTNLDLEVAAVLSPTTLWLQKLGGKFNTFEKPFAFNGGSMQIVQQERNSLQEPIILRAVYQEEPTVALRTIPVSRLGNPISTPEGNLETMEPNARFIYGPSFEVLKIREFAPDAEVGDYCRETQFTYGPSLEVLKVKAVHSVVTVGDLA